jgi:hypothetical protein
MTVKLLTAKLMCNIVVRIKKFINRCGLILIMMLQEIVFGALVSCLDWCWGEGRKEGMRENRSLRRWLERISMNSTHFLMQAINNSYSQLTLLSAFRLVAVCAIQICCATTGHDIQTTPYSHLHGICSRYRSSMGWRCETWDSCFEMGDIGCSNSCI